MPSELYLWQDWVWQCYLLFRNVNGSGWGECTFKGSWQQAVVLGAMLAGTTFLLFPSGAEHILIFLAATEHSCKILSCLFPFFPCPLSLASPSSLTVGMHAHILREAHGSALFWSLLSGPWPFLYLWEPPFFHALLLEPCKEIQGVWTKTAVARIKISASSFWNILVFGIY